MVLRGRADLHLHTTASDGWPAPHQLVDYARATRLDVIAVTDHDTIEGALRAADYAAGFSKLHVVIGEEVSSRDGHIVALYVERRIRPGMSAAATVHAIVAYATERSIPIHIESRESRYPFGEVAELWSRIEKSDSLAGSRAAALVPFGPGPAGAG